MADTAPSAKGSRKRKSEGPKFYAVKAGHSRGVKLSWDDCKESITGFKGASYKSFPTMREAEDFVAGRVAAAAEGAKSIKFYGVAEGKNPGVYTNWTEAEAQIKGWKNPKYKKFATRAEAETFVESGGKSLQPQVVDSDNGSAEGGEVDRNEPPSKRVRRSVEDFDEGDGETQESEVVTTVVPPKGKVLKKEKPLKIWTDGSSLGNGRAGAAAGVGVFFGHGDPRNISERLKGDPQTNQRAELTGLLRALEVAPMEKEVAIYTDSNYSINCVTTWFPNWEKRGWQTSASKPVMNQDLIQAVLAKIRERQNVEAKTIFNWIKGHSNDPGNEAADRLAVAGAQMPRTDLIT